MAEWTEEEKAYIKENAPNQTIQELQKRFPYRSSSSIRYIIGHMGVGYLAPKKEWSGEEIVTLKEVWSHHASDRPKILAALPKRSWFSIRHKVRQLNLALESKSRPWTAAEVDLIRASYGKLSNQVLAKKLGRSKDAIRAKAKRMGIQEVKLHSKPKARRTPKQASRVWDCAEVEYLRTHISTLSWEQMGKDLHRSSHAVRQKADTLGLSIQNPNSSKALRKKRAKQVLEEGHSLKTLHFLLSADIDLTLEEVEAWPSLGLKIKTRKGEPFVTTVSFRRFLKAHPEVLDVYTLGGANLFEFTINPNTWPEPPAFKTYKCSMGHGPIDFCVDLYAKEVRCPKCSRVKNPFKPVGYTDDFFD